MQPVVLVPGEDPVPFPPPADPEEGYTLDELRAGIGITDKDLIQIVNFQDGRIMIMDEEGKFKGLPRNARATEHATYHQAIFPNDWISGTAIVCPDGWVK